MKIGIFSETYHPTMNGVVVSIDTFKRELEKRGHEYFIFAPENPKETKSEKNVYRFPALLLQPHADYPLAKSMPFALAQKYLPLDIIQALDLIHIQHFSAMGQYGLSCGHKYNIPTVYTYHTMVELYTHYLPVIGPLATYPMQAWTRYTANRATHIVVPTQSVKSHLQSIGVKKPMSVIPTGIETNLYKRTPAAYLEQHYGIPKSRDIILFVGRLTMEKNVSLLLDAFYRIQLALPNTQLLIVGDGPDRAKFEQMLKARGLSTHVTFTGFLKRAETIKLFGTADIFAFPSITDTQGIVIIEAMAAGTVPVAIDRLGPHDIIKDGLTGKLTDLSVEDFSGTIIALLKDKDKLNNLCIAARHQAKQFDTAVTADAMEKLYVRLTNRRRS